MFATIPSATPQIRNGKLRALAVTGATRFPALPEVPTVMEAGLAGYEAGQWLGVFAPARTPTGRRAQAQRGDQQGRGLAGDCKAAASTAA